MPPRRPRGGLGLALLVPALFLLAAPGNPFAQGTVPAPSASAPGGPSGGIREEDLLKAPRPAAVVPVHTVVIDPGHGGRDTGVRGEGDLFEKDVVLKVAQRLSRLIQGRLGIRVVLTRTGDYTLPLLERTAIANHAKGQLFISLHTEGGFRRDADGYRVFTLKPGPPPKPETRRAGENGPLQAILWDIAQTSYLNESGRFARLIADALTRETGLRARPVREAQLLVLRGSRMPAVLVSIAHLTNPQEAALLSKDEFLDGVARSLYDALRRFVAGKDVGR